MSELDRFCQFCERFLTTEEGRPLVVEPWQREILADYFAGARELTNDSGAGDDALDDLLKGQGK